MARLIDADALLDYFRNEHHESEVIEAVKDAPTIDAVPVVRCCDCVSCKVILDNVGAGHWHCKKRYGLPEVDPTDFFSSGERKDNV